MTAVQYVKSLQNAQDCLRAMGEFLTKEDFAVFKKRQGVNWCKFEREYNRDVQAFWSSDLSVSDENKMTALIMGIVELALAHNLTIAEAMVKRREVKL